MSETWPRTGRWLPWLIAGFLVLAWFVPIDSITLRGFSAFDLKLDRLLLAAIGLVWLFSVCAGGPAAPRLQRLGPASVAILALALVALFSVLWNLQVLLRVDDDDLAQKKLFLLASYVAFFLIVATSLRPADIEPMARLFMWLGAIVGVAVLYDRFQGTNLNFWLAHHTLPGSAFSIREVAHSPHTPNPITGPTRHPLGAAGMLSMALPFAIVEALRSRDVRRKVVHALLFVAIAGGIWATNRKTGIFASVAALSFLTILQPQRMIVRALPLLALGVLVLAAVRPHAVSHEFNRLSPSTFLKGGSAKGRSSDYPAIVPDFREHPALGRGWGSYDPAKYRILDNNYLVMLIEVGLLGLSAFAAAIIATWTMARRVARSIGESRAGPALAAAAGTAAFAVSMALFDATAFPQVPYFFFFLAGLVTVLWRALVEPEVVTAPAVAVPA